MTPEIQGIRLRRTRSRVESLKIDKEMLANRIKNFYDKDMQDRSGEIDARLQRYAKYRMWTEPKNWPWTDATNSAIPDMMVACGRMEDTLHNAVMSSRPPIMAKPRFEKVDADKGEMVTNLLDFQFFEEQPGEDLVGKIANDFVTEGLFTIYTPWIKESRRVKDVKVYDPMPEGVSPMDYFLPLLEGFFKGAEITPSGDGWDWKINRDGKRSQASFFTRNDDQIELDLEREIEVFNGPRAIRKDVQDVLHPARCENLQIKSPSNPEGASHVILRDYPSLDEIKRLATKDETGSVFYDLLTDEDREKLGLARMDTTYQQREEQKDIMQGQVEQKPVPKGAESHQTLTRVKCFDCYDVDGDGLDEDVVVTMILETKTICRIRYLSQEFPSKTPRRPFAEAQLFPVPGRRLAIGMLELMEGVHDLTKQFFDQGGDAGTLANTPIGFYRAASNIRPETIAMEPGMLYPVSDTQRDIVFPQIGNSNQSFMFNMLSLLTQWDEKLSTIGDLQMGRVPQGKASALRTVAGMQTVLSQGDARPERVLRRFFMGLAQIWQNFHDQNEVLLPTNKKFVLSGPNVDPSKEPYAEVGNLSEIQGNYRFTFSANVLNTSKEALQGALEKAMAVVMSPLNIQLKITGADEIYRLERDYIRSLGPDPDKYLRPPTPNAMEPPIGVEDAILMLMQGIMPEGSPMEGAAEHFQKLQEFAQSDEFGHMDPMHVTLFKHYLQKTAQLAMQEAQQQALLAASAQFSQQMTPKGMPGPQGSGMVDQSMAPVQGNELVDETLPGAGGGANTGGA